MRIAIVGASGFIGKNLVKSLLLLNKCDVVAISRHPEKLKYLRSKRLILVDCDIFETEKLAKSLNNCDLVYYLVHMMSRDYVNFPELEINAAKSFCIAMKIAKIKKSVYLGGLGDDKKKLSEHLKSRHMTGKILSQNIQRVYEFRASLIIGEGSASFEIVRSIVNKTHFMILPAWANTLVQPIALSDTIAYLTEAISLNVNGHKIIEIGGPDTMTYKELLIRYAHFKNRRLQIFVINWLPNWPAKYWLNLFIDKKHYSVALAMLKSLENDVIVNDKFAQDSFSNIVTKKIETEFV